MAPFLLLLAHPPYLEPTKQTNSISPSQAFVKIEFSASSQSLLGSPSLGVTEEDEEGHAEGKRVLQREKWEWRGDPASVTLPALQPRGLGTDTPDMQP